MFVPLLFLAVACVNIEIGVYVVCNDWRSASHRAFGIYSLGSGLWIGGFSLFLLTHSTLYLSVLNLGGLLILLGFIRIVVTLPGRVAPHVHWLWYLPFIPAFIVALHPGLLIRDVVFTQAGVVPVQGEIFLLYAAGVALYAIATVVLLWRAYRKSTAHRRVQLQYFMLGNAAFVLVAALCDLVLPAIGVFAFNLVGPVSSVIAIGTTAYAIVWHELMDIRVVIQRGVIYSTILALIIALYIALVNVIAFIFGSVSTEAYYTSAGITTIAGIYGVPLIERYFKKITQRIFFKDVYDYALALKTLSEALHRNLDLSVMIAEAHDVFEEIFHPETISILPTGSVVLGAKRSGDRYTREDARLLETFSHLAATAFERGRLFEEAKKHAAELEAKVDARTRQLRIAKENQERMMIDISHNLQTPLTILRMKLKVLKDVVPDDAEIESFEVSLVALSRFIDDLMTLARLEHGAEPSGFVRCDLSMLVRDIAEESAIIAASQGVKIRTHIDPGFAIRCNTEQVRQAIMNLASNALKYMKSDGKREIDFSVSNDYDRVTVTIADTGIGISAEDVSRIFDRFYRANTSRGSVTGSGLGLAITKRIVELNEGTISAESVVGKGTAVTLVFPALNGDGL